MMTIFESLICEDNVGIYVIMGSNAHMRQFLHKFVELDIAKSRDVIHIPLLV
jgi:hypothetical protein